MITPATATPVDHEGGMTRRAFVAGAVCAGVVTTGSVMLFDVVRNASSVRNSVRVVGGGAAPSASPLRGLKLVGVTAGSVVLAWEASLGAGRVVSRQVERDGVVLQQLAADVMRFADTEPRPGHTHSYRLLSLDRDGNDVVPTAALRVTVPGAILAEDFESSLPGWQLGGLHLAQGVGRHGSQALYGETSDGRTWAELALPDPVATLSCQVYVQYQDKEPDSSLSVLRLRGVGDAPLCGLFVSADGHLGLRNDLARINKMGAGGLSAGSWHCLWLRLERRGAASLISAGANGMVDPMLAGWSQDLSDVAVASLQLGELRPAKRYRLALDDVVVWR